MPKAFVGVTDGDWYELLRSLPNLDEVNFWQPSARGVFRALAPGELFLFKLHSPRDFIVGGGFFAHHTILPVSMAWDAFGEKNGASTLAEMRSRIQKYRREPVDSPDPMIGCVLLEQPFFIEPELWMPVPDWKPNIVRGRTYDLASEPGLTLQREIESRLAASRPAPVVVAEPAARYGEALVRIRLGQGSFRVVVTDAYRRQCAITAERVLPVLEAAHIRPFAEGGDHRVDNGLLLRSDLHTLFDRGYVTVTPEFRVEVSGRLRDDFDNGEEYRRWHGSRIALPEEIALRPGNEFLEWHNENRCVA